MVVWIPKMLHPKELRYPYFRPLSRAKMYGKALQTILGTTNHPKPFQGLARYWKCGNPNLTLRACPKPKCNASRASHKLKYYEKLVSRILMYLNLSQSKLLTKEQMFLLNYLLMMKIQLTSLPLNVLWISSRNVKLEIPKRRLKALKKTPQFHKLCSHPLTITQ